MINGNLVDDFKNKENPTAYLSRNINIIKGNFDEYSEYENKYGPLSVSEVNSTKEFTWVNNWPWEVKNV